MLAGTEDAILMIEGFCDFLTEEQVLEAITKWATMPFRRSATPSHTWQTQIGKPKNRAYLRNLAPELLQEVEN